MKNPRPKRAPNPYPRPHSFPRRTLEPGNYIGADECGYGALCGPVVICSAAIKPGLIDGVRDSKKLSRAVIPLLANNLKSAAVVYKLVLMSPKYIDDNGLDKAWDVGMSAAIEEIQKECDWPVVIDGAKLPSGGKNLTAFPKADESVYQVSAASIIAKAKQLEIMADLDRRFPQYGLADCAGYGTKKHIEALKKYGPCPEHRKSFLGVISRETPREELEYSEGRAKSLTERLGRLDDNPYASEWEKQFVRDVRVRMEAGKALSTRQMFFLNAIARRRRT